MIYAAFSVYLLGILFAALGVYRLWAGMVRPRWVNWALLPGTVVAEMAYIFGCLITGGEIRRAKLMGSGAAPARRGRSSGQGEEVSKSRSSRFGASSDAEPTTEAEPKLRSVGPIVAAFMTIVACGAGIVIAHALLGKPVIQEFLGVGWVETSGLPNKLPKALPGSTGTFWAQVDHHIGLLRRMGRTWLELSWSNWRVPLFVYLATCLTIRLAPVRRSLRASLAAVVVIAGIIALIGGIWNHFDGLMDDIWPLVTYIWSSLLFALTASLVVRGGVGLVRALLEKESPAKGASA